jgi:hypothetical protein
VKYESSSPIIQQSSASPREKQQITPHKKISKQHYKTQNYWDFGHFSSSDILENRNHDVLETGSVSVLR